MNQQKSTVMSEKEVEHKVISIISQQLDVDKAEICRESTFVNDLSADSLDRVELILKLEDVFEMNISDEQLENMQTVGQAIDYIVEHLNGKK